MFKITRFRFFEGHTRQLRFVPRQLIGIFMYFFVIYLNHLNNIPKVSRFYRQRIGLDTCKFAKRAASVNNQYVLGLVTLHRVYI